DRERAELRSVGGEAVGARGHRISRAVPSYHSSLAILRHHALFWLVRQVGRGAVIRAPHVVMTIFPKWRLGRIISKASAMFSSGKVLATGSDSLPDSTAGHRSRRISRTISRTSSGLRVRKVTPI